MVVRVDRASNQQERLGATSKAPRWCIAFKYPAEQGTTVLRGVDWQVGKGGTLTPRATMDPIFSSPAPPSSTRRCTTSRRFGARTFASETQVVIEKAGEIIPQVDQGRGRRRSAAARPRKITAPTEVSRECDGVVEQEGPKLYCINPECPAQLRERIQVVRRAAGRWTSTAWARSSSISSSTRVW